MSKEEEVSVPFSKGMVLHLSKSALVQKGAPMVSVPFSKGMVLHLVHASAA